MKVYGYVRVSTEGQNPERQIAKMRELGMAEGDLFVDKASGKDLERPAYAALLDRLERGDKVVFDSLDRLGRDYDDVTREWRRLTREAGVSLKVLDLEFFDSESFDSMGPVGKCVEDMLLSLLAYVAQTERDKNRQRQAEGIAIAKAAGKYRGSSKRVYPEEVLRDAQAALSAEGKSAAARVLGCDRATVYRMLADGRLTA